MLNLQAAANMRHYERILKAHLALYKRRRLGIQESGEYDGREYQHILPERLKFLNVLEGMRAEVQEYLRANPKVRLHKYFHHLNSSQALAFNLFFPFLSEGAAASKLLSDALMLEGGVIEWWFERVHDTVEGTNVDVAWRGEGNAHVFCEVKLSERDFGVALADQRHLKKRLDVYLPKLQGLVEDSLMEPSAFFQNYQLLRNVSLLCGDSGHTLLLIVPAENESLRPSIERVVTRLTGACVPRVRVVHLETLLDQLQASTVQHSRLFMHSVQLKEKYVLVPSDVR